MFTTFPNPDSQTPLTEHRCIENIGQFERDDIRYYAAGDPVSVSFGEEWIEYIIRRPRGGDEYEVLQYRVTFSNAMVTTPTGSRDIGLSNYLTGNVKSDWITGARHNKELIYYDVWDGIDIRFFFTEGKLKYELLLDPYTDPAIIIFEFEGIDDLTIDEPSGDLIIYTSLGEIREDAPFTYQLGGDGRIPIASSFSVHSSSELGFDFNGLEHGLATVIDPGMVFSSGFGGTRRERIGPSNLMTFDGDDNITRCSQRVEGQ